MTRVTVTVPLWVAGLICLSRIAKCVGLSRVSARLLLKAAPSLRASMERAGKERR